MTTQTNPFERIAAQREALVAAWRAALDVPDDKVFEAEERAGELYGDRSFDLIEEARSIPATTIGELAVKIRLMITQFEGSEIPDEWRESILEDAERLAGGAS